MSRPAVRIATRASALALWQANDVADRLRQLQTGCRVELIRVTTKGDRDRVAPLTQWGGAGTFTREVQEAVLDRRADVAVHSLKDLPTETADGMTLAAVPERASCFDALVLPDSAAKPDGLDALPDKARIGTGSLRRRAQLLHFRSDLQMLDVRGNVETRIRKLDEGSYDALVLAIAGLNRLGLQERISFRLEPPLFFPAVGQGALGIECRKDDERVRGLLSQISDLSTLQSVIAERHLLAVMRAGCHAPLGVWSRCDGQRLTLDAVVLSQDGRERVFASESGPADQPESLGQRVAEQLKRQGADGLIEQAQRSLPSAPAARSKPQADVSGDKRD